MMFPDVHSQTHQHIVCASRRIRLVLAARELLAVCGLCALILALQT